jgi:glycosyltransferase involved in cell wall biosynthesis
MIVRNEQDHLPRCLASVQTLVDEIIIVDTGSTDRTLEIAYEFGAKVLHHPWHNDYSEIRNASIKIARGEWILLLDADETLSRQDYKYIRKCMRSKTYEAYLVTTRNYRNEPLNPGWVPCDKKYEESSMFYGWFPSVKIRLFRRHPGIYFEGVVHEDVIYSVKRLGLKIGECPVPVHHFQDLKGADIVQQKQLCYKKLGEKKLKGKFRHIAEANFDQGCACYSFGQFARAEKYLKKALKLLAKSTLSKKDIKRMEEFSHYELGLVYYAVEKIGEAAGEFKKALEINPKCLIARIRLGFALEKLRKHAQAMVEYRKAMKINHNVARVFPRLQDVHHLIH